MNAPERKHHYGSFFHLTGDVFHDQILARFCSPETHQPEITRLAKILSRYLLIQAVNRSFSTQTQAYETRMIAHHKEAVCNISVVNPSSKVVVVDLMRAGILPSQICFETLHEILNPQNLRQDHILLNRKTDAHDQVVGVQISGHKIGGDAQNSTVIIADPMGATGGTITSVIDIYDHLEKLNPKWSGRPQKFLALHFIVTPEYLKRVAPFADRLEVFALRVDRGLSAPAILKTDLGSQWDAEKGLNEKQYIVPGAGGIGEILNNALV